MRANVGFSISRFPYRECHGISNYRLKQFTVELGGLPHYEAYNTPYNLKYPELHYASLRIQSLTLGELKHKMASAGKKRKNLMNPLEQLRKDWNDLAEVDPLWAICSVPGKSHGKWHVEEFFNTGKKTIKRALSIVYSSGVALKRGTVLDFGCGIGRLTQALAEEFHTCYGVDVSSKMIELANEFNRFDNKCKYIVSSKNDLSVFDSNFFDFIYTEYVLQHMPPELMKGYLEEFIRTLKAGGILVFQVPMQWLVQDERIVHIKRLPRYHPQRILHNLRAILIGEYITTSYYFFRRLGFSKKWLYEKFGFRPPIRMYCLEEAEIYELIANLGAEIVHVVKNIETETLNGTFVVKKLL